MFENLTDKLQRAFKNLRGQGTLTEENIGDALREIRMALLEADVNLNVVKQLVEHIRERGNTKDVFTISLHQENNYPLVKPPSSIDVNLPDGCGDSEYLAWLDNALSSGLRQFEPELICYVAGADPFREDQLGGLSLTIEGLKERDRLVFRAARARGIPIMVTFAGGYAIRVEDTVTIHTNTILAGDEVFAPARAVSA